MVKHSAVRHACKTCSSDENVQRWTIGFEDIHRTKYMCQLCAYRYNAYKLNKSGEKIEYARETFHMYYWNLPVGNRRVYCIYFDLVDGFENPQDYCDFEVLDAKSWQEIAVKELLSCTEDTVRVDIYDIPESLRYAYGSDLELSQLGECAYSVNREDINGNI